MWAKLGISILGMVIDKLIWPLIDRLIKDVQRKNRLKDKMGVNRRKTEAVEQAKTPQEVQDAIDNAP